ncbi:MAG: right-handed parallel beta-helix repeat-containing protein [Terrimicrobiaceae bacterium]
MGMLFLYCEDIRLRKIRVTPLSRSRALSTNADATHFNSCRGAIVFDGCTFERMGDDAINIHGTYLRLKDVLSPKSIRVVTGRRDVDWMPVSPRAGDQISIHSPQNPFGDPLFLGIVVSTKSEPSTRSAEVSFQGGVPQELPEDAVVWNRSASPRLTVRNCTFLNNRARGILVQCGNALIEHNWFEGMSGSAINVTCDVGTWWESGPTENVTIRNNMIAHCNDGAGASAGAISVFADAPGIPPQRGVHRRVRIENNSIRQVLRAGISISSSADVIISGNAIREVFGPGVLVRSSTDVKISNNRFEEVTENVAHE